MNVLYLEVFTRGMVFSGRIAVLAIYFEQQYGFRPLDVGIVFMVNAIVMIFSSLWLTKKLQMAFGKRPAVYYSSIVEGIVMVLFAQGWLWVEVTKYINMYCFCPLDKFLNHVEVLAGFEDAEQAKTAMTAAAAGGDSGVDFDPNAIWCIRMHPYVIPVMLSCITGICTSLRGSTASAIMAELSSVENRGATFGRFLMISNTGRIFGPILAGQMASWYGVAELPWICMGIVLAVSVAGQSVFFLGSAVGGGDDKKKDASGASDQKVSLTELQDTKTKPLLAKTKTAMLFSEKSVLEALERDEYEKVTDEDILELGRVVAQLLKERHYRWRASEDRERVVDMLDHAFPELDVEHEYEDYVNSRMRASAEGVHRH